MHPSRNTLQTCRHLVLRLLIIFFVLGSGHDAFAEASLKPCWVDGFAQQVQCGSLLRPLDPTHPQATQITIHFIVLGAQDKNKAPDPVFLLAGGPGQSAISVASYIQTVFEKLHRRHDLVFVDQRGTGQSAPLTCPDYDDLQGIGIAGYAVRQMLSCKARLEKLPYGDLRFFTTSLAMQDLDAVRAALNYPVINLLGVSYGTRAALEYQRQFPQRVRRSVLDGVVEPGQMMADEDVQKSLDLLLRDCQTDARCRQVYPALAHDWKMLLASLPRRALLTHPRLGTVVSAVVTPNDVLNWTTRILYSPVTSAALAPAIEQARSGNFNPLMALSGVGALPNPGSIAMGMHFAVVCSEEYRHGAVAVISNSSDFGDLHSNEYRQVCAQWPEASVPDGFYQQSPSRSPVLLLSGGLDPVTPPWHAAKVAAALGPLARHVVLEHAGHGVLQQSCLTEVASHFLNAANDSLANVVDTACVKQIPRPSVWLAPIQQVSVQAKS